MSNQLRISWYAITIFLSSAILLVLEITAGRLIAPYVGVTIYSWTSIIGVILAGLSIGNWLGGVMADRGSKEASVGVVLLLAAIFSVLSLWALTFVAPLIHKAELDLVSASFFYVLAMFFVPSILLGIPTPLLTTLALKLDDRTGHIVGRMNALAAVGSIVGTFVTGFVLIQYVGSRNVVIISAAVLVVLAIPFFRKIGAATTVALIGVLSLSSWVTHQNEGFNNPCDYESNYFCLRVVDANHMSPGGNAKGLILDHLLHGVNHEEEPDLLIAPYVHLMQELVGYHFRKEPEKELSYFFAGGGSFTQPRAANAITPNAKVTVAELDPMVTEVVQKEMYVNTEDMEIIHGDARTILNRLDDRKFDVVVTDAFHDIAIPYHLVTQEYAQIVKSRMSADGIYTTNVVDAFPDPHMVKSLVKTLQEEFKYVDVWLDQIPKGPERMTYVIAANNVKETRYGRIPSKIGLERQWYRVNGPLMSTGISLDELTVFTDDFVPVERMISSLLLTKEGI